RPERGGAGRWREKDARRRRTGCTASRPAGRSGERSAGRADGRGRPGARAGRRSWSTRTERGPTWPGPGSRGWAARPGRRPRGRAARAGTRADSRPSRRRPEPGSGRLRRPSGCADWAASRTGDGTGRTTGRRRDTGGWSDCGGSRQPGRAVGQRRSWRDGRGVETPDTPDEARLETRLSAGRRQEANESPLQPEEREQALLHDAEPQEEEHVV